MTSDNTSMAGLSRRALIVGAPLALAACAAPHAPVTGPVVDRRYALMYGPIYSEPFPIPAIDVSRIDPRWFRQEVEYQTSERPGTIVVNPHERHLYLVRENGRAMRYGVGVGKAGFDYRGDAVIQRKAEWPRWTPTQNMVALDPSLEEYAGGVDGGLRNPLGARALYLYRNGRDTLYRIHGTIEPWSIGQSVSSGCVRLFNHDIIDLYGRVPHGTRVVVLS